MSAARINIGNSSSNATTTSMLQSVGTVVAIAFVHAFVVNDIRKRRMDKIVKRHNHDECSKKKKHVDRGGLYDEEKKEEQPSLTVNETDLPSSVSITLPEWSYKFYDERKNIVYTSDIEMMKVAKDLSSENVMHDTGGPFGTAIFEYSKETGESKLFSIGVNRVVPLCNSTLHGEMTAIQFGQQRINDFSFACAGSRNNKEYHLYTSSAPCCQCLGGVMWSGVSKLVCGANKSDVEAIGFCEGPVFDPLSYDALEEAGCKVVRNVMRDECSKVLQWYKQKGEIYNP